MEDFLSVIAGCAQKNGKCQQALYEQYRGYAFKVVFRYVQARAEASEVVNDGFVKMFTNIQKFEATSDGGIEKIFMGWLKKIMINSAIDRLRRNEANLKTETLTNEEWKVPGDVPDAADILLYNDLIKMVKQLPPQSRMVFNLSVIDGYTHTEIAEMIGIPEGTSRSHLSRARTLLQHSIKTMEENKRCRI